MDLLSELSLDFAATSHVASEITDNFPDQQRRFKDALAADILSELNVNAPTELALFAAFSESGQLGSGECSAIAVAIN